MAKVRKFDTGITGVPEQKTSYATSQNIVPKIATEIADRVAASAPMKVTGKPGNPRPRRYKQKTYSLLQEDIDLIEALVAEVRRGGLYERGRSDVVRAGVKLLSQLPLEEKLKAFEAIESLKAN